MKLEIGHEYIHKSFGRVLLLASHPYDGALLIIERQSTTDRDDDDKALDGCESCDLSPAEGTTWPHLGFTSAARSDEVKQRWSAKHGFAEVSSGRWAYPDGTAVPSDVWAAAWDKDYITTQEETP